MAPDRHVPAAPEGTPLSCCVVGTDEGEEIAYVWVESRRPEVLEGRTPRHPHGMPTEEQARAAIVQAAKDWEYDDLDPSLLRPRALVWFKTTPENDEGVACDDDDPDREDLFWLWDIYEAVVSRG